ncbi:MAG: sigma-54 dependent transcriptional regulator [Isosphaeraceae bacterium]|nr:sigma-54 dependent transcriptional regulator [Isosphaeraceae bacterium]
MASTSVATPRILITDDEQDIRWMLSTLLNREGFDTVEAHDGPSALDLLKRDGVDVALLDIRMPGLDGLQVLQAAKKHDETVPIILVTAYGSTTAAVEAVKQGASGYLTKPFKNEELIFTVHTALEKRRRRAALSFSALLDGESELLAIRCCSPGLRKTLADIERVAPTNFTVVITGETGVGKELVAREIHRLSHRASSPFIALDCGSLAPSLIESELFGHEKGAFTGADRTRIGSFENAAAGTLFLDEIGNLPLSMQAKLLRVLQERRVCRVGGSRLVQLDVRILAATNEDLEAKVEAGLFRRDLYHRLNEFSIVVPPLRERPEDIIAITEQCLSLICAELGKQRLEISPTALKCLLSYPWPGNVRELRNTIRRAALLADAVVEPEHLGSMGLALSLNHEPTDVDPGVTDPVSLKEIVQRRIEQVEREILVAVLKKTGGNKAKAARILQIDYKTIRTKAKQYGIPL